MSKKKKFNITKSLLQGFVKEGLSREQMAKKVGCSVANINLKMSEFDLVKRRAKRGAAKKKSSPSRPSGAARSKSSSTSAQSLKSVEKILGMLKDCDASMASTKEALKKDLIELVKGL